MSYVSWRLLPKICILTDRRSSTTELVARKRGLSRFGGYLGIMVDCHALQARRRREVKWCGDVTHSSNLEATTRFRRLVARICRRSKFGNLDVGARFVTASSAREARLES